MTSPDLHRQRFLSLAASDHHALPLDLLALLIAGDENPDFDVDHWLSELDLIADAAKGRGNLDQRIAALFAHLYEKLGLRGNRIDYYDPRNSFLDQVIERRLGIPISLGVLCLEVGRRLDLPLVGIGFPGRFLLGRTDCDTRFYDPFDRARVMDREECRRLFGRLFGPDRRWERSNLTPVGSRQVLLRMLTNLQQIYLRQSDTVRTAGCLDRILALYPDSAEHRRSRGLLRLQLGFEAAAIDDLESYLELAPDCVDSASIQGWIESARRSGVLIN